MKRRLCKIQCVCSLLLATASLLCLWRSYESTSTTRNKSLLVDASTPTHKDKESTAVHDTNARIVSSSSSTENNESENLSRMLQTMQQLAASEEGATCNHSVYNTVEWMVVAAQGDLRTNVPLSRAIQDPTSLLLIGNGDYNTNEALSMQVCRRDCCVSGGTCLDETFVFERNEPTITNTTATPECKTPPEISSSLQYGAWKRHSSGKESWLSSACTIPSTRIAPPSNKKQQVLFIGDSTLQELALLTAQASRATPNLLGIRNNTHLNCTCTTAITPGTTKDCRVFDATGLYVNTSMLWAGHMDCNDNRMGVDIVDNGNWRNMVSNKVATLQPDTIFLQVPISHSCTDLVSCENALKRYICFTTRLSSSRVVLLITGAAISRFQCEGPTGRHCPSALRRWIAHIKSIMQQLAPQVPILDIFTPTEQWVNLTAPKDPFLPGCKSMQRHLTCDFTSLDFSKAVDSPFYILPPGRLAGAAIMHMLSMNNDEKTMSSTNKAENDSCRAMLGTMSSLS